MSETAVPLICWKCQLPIVGATIWIDGRAHHQSCLHLAVSDSVAPAAPAPVQFKPEDVLAFVSGCIAASPKRFTYHELLAMWQRESPAIYADLAARGIVAPVERVLMVRLPDEPWENAMPDEHLVAPVEGAEYRWFYMGEQA